MLEPTCSECGDAGYTCDTCGRGFAAAPQAPSGQQAEPTEEQIANAWREAQGKVDHETIRRMYRALAGQLAVSRQSERPASKWVRCEFCSQLTDRNRIDPIHPSERPAPADSLKWCDHCGEGVTTFCRGKQAAATCPMFAPAGQAVDALRIHHEWSLRNMPGYSEHGDERVAYRATVAALASSQAERPSIKESSTTEGQP